MASGPLEKSNLRRKKKQQNKKAKRNIDAAAPVLLTVGFHRIRNAKEGVFGDRDTWNCRLAVFLPKLQARNAVSRRICSRRRLGEGG